MRRLSFLVAMIFAVTAFVSFDPVSARKRFGNRRTVENFKLTDTSGTMQSFNDLKGKNGAVLVFLSVQCPVVKGYDARIVKLAAEYAGKRHQCYRHQFQCDRIDRKGQSARGGKL